MGIALFQMTAPAAATPYSESDIIDIADAWMPLFEPPPRKQFYVLCGGRGGGKSTAVGFGVLTKIEYIESVLGVPARVLCLRERQKTVGESVKALIEECIRKTGREQVYRILEDRIITPRHGVILFRGMSNITSSQIKSLQSIHLCWFEEAEDMSVRSRELLYPTIFRNTGSEVWLTFNPTRRTDPVYLDFIAPGRRKAVARVMVGLYSDMPPAWRSAEQESERLLNMEMEPERYPHIWLGELDDEGVENRVMTMANILACIEAYKEGLHEGAGGMVEAGLDVADSNWNAMTVRHGPTVLSAERWHSDIIATTARRAHKRALEYGVQRLHYDAGGPGAGVTSYFRDELSDRRYGVRAELFGGAVKGAEQIFTTTIPNKDYFARRNAQLGWGLRLRAEMTRRLMRGEDVNPLNCLFISDEIKDLNTLTVQLFQPTWREGSDSHIELMKAAKDESSPDMYDATVLAFAQDSVNGLRLRLR